MIEFQQVRKQYGERDVLADVSLRVNPGERIGIVGPNGAGKSTLFALIEGVEKPDKGKVLLPNSFRLGHVRQQLHAHAVGGGLLEFTTRSIPELDRMLETIHAIEAELEGAGDGERRRLLDHLGSLQTRFEHLGGYEMRNRAEAALGGLGFSTQEFDRPFREFSGGWQMRAELARTLIGNPDVLLLDEPSNYLDLPAVEWLQRYLKEFLGTLLLISHDRYLLQSLTTNIVEVENGNLTRYAGGYDDYTRARAERHHQHVAAYKNQQRKLQQVERFVERFRAKNTKASQVQSRIKALEKIERLEEPKAAPEVSLIRVADPPHCGSEVVRLEQAGVTYDGARWVLRGVDLSVQRGDKLALVGFNGLGKTTLLRVLAGQRPPSEGTRVLGHNVVVGYQSQELAETMNPDQSAYDIVKEAAPDRAVKEIRSLLGSFGFSGDDVRKPCRVLSGGETIRLAFARVFINPPNFLVLDEPTTHLDLHGRRALEAALSTYEGTICFVSHDVEFVRHMASEVIAMTPPGITRYAGGYDYYREKSGPAQDPQRIAAKPRSGGGAKAARKVRAEERQALHRQKNKWRKQLKRAEDDVSRLEAEQEDLVERIEQDGVSDFEQVNRRLSEIQAELRIHTEEWEEAAEALESLIE